MAAENLTAPLGQNDPDQDKGFMSRIPVLTIFASLIGAILLLVFMWVMIVDNPLGGEPTATVDIIKSQSNQDIAEVMKEAGDPDQNKINQDPDFQVPPLAKPDGPLIIQTSPNVQNIKKPNEEQVAENIEAQVNEQNMFERSPYGLIPKKSPNGIEPSQYYARKVLDDTGLSTGPKIAILITGLGLSQTGTQLAIKELPEDVTLAFAPYGGSLERWSRLARDQGHEIMLQIPMEPFDYPDSDPGPHTLLASQDSRINIDRLHWFMTRIKAYTGVVNYLGAKFTSSEEDVKPFVNELSKRGLSYVDDGVSSRSMVGQFARLKSVPFSKGDIILDHHPTEDYINGRLAELEKMAEANGYAIGIASSLPSTISSISAWAKTLNERDITLIPVSALAKRR